jgi:hypothetical protein
MKSVLKFLLWVAQFIVSLVWALCFPERRQAAGAAAVAKLDPSAPSAASLRDGHEISDARPKIVVALGVGLFLVIFATMAVLGWMYTRLYTSVPSMPVPSIQESFKDAPYTKTGIARGSVHIPIARAMELIAREGLPSRKAQTPLFPPPGEEKLPVSDTEKTGDATNFHAH